MGINLKSAAAVLYLSSMDSKVECRISRLHYSLRDYSI